jgi:hypothetical protein
MQLILNVLEEPHVSTWKHPLRSESFEIIEYVGLGTLLKYNIFSVQGVYRMEICLLNC